MSSRDWALTALVGFLIAAIALFFNATVALAIFRFGAVLALVWAIFDPWLKKHLFVWLRPGPKTRPISTDPTTALLVSLEDEQWSSFHHKARFLRIKFKVR